MDEDAQPLKTLNMSKSENVHLREMDDGYHNTPKVTKGQKLKRNCARFWWVYLIVFVIVVLVVLLPM
jgi:hypothetical protein